MHVLVVDDEPLARRRLLGLLKRMPAVTATSEAASVQEALAALSRGPFDLILLDIEMPERSGLELAQLRPLPPIIFITAHPDFAIEAFELAAVDYLLKPVSQERLERALLRVGPLQAEAQDSKLTQRLTVRVGPTLEFIEPKAISRIEAGDKYVFAWVDGREHILDKSLLELESELHSQGFVRVHRSALVRLGAVNKLHLDGSRATLELSDGATVRVSRRQLPTLRRLLGC